MWFNRYFCSRVSANEWVVYRPMGVGPTPWDLMAWVRRGGCGVWWRGVHRVRGYACVGEARWVMVWEWGRDGMMCGVRGYDCVGCGGVRVYFMFVCIYARVCSYIRSALWDEHFTTTRTARGLYLSLYNLIYIISILDHVTGREAYDELRNKWSLVLMSKYIRWRIFLKKRKMQIYA